MKLDEHFKEIPNTEKEWNVDTVCLATGLIPSVTLLAQAGCEMKYIPALGGYVPLRNRLLETTLKNVFVAGDADGIEEASTAIMEGRIAAFAIAQKEGIDKTSELNETLDELKRLRSGPFGKKILSGIAEAENARLS